MSTPAQLISDQLKEIIKVKMKTGNGEREAQQKVEEGEKVINPDNTSSILDTVLNTLNNKFAPKCVDEVVRLLNAHPICQSRTD